MAITYVGTPAGSCNTSTGALIGSPANFGSLGGVFSDWTQESGTATVVCPGSGLQDVEDLGWYGLCGASPDTIRVGIYAFAADTGSGAHPAGALMAQFTSAMSVTNNGNQYNHQTSGGITQFYQLNGGTSYIMIWTVSIGNFNPVFSAGSAGDSKFNTTDYTTSGFPSTLPGTGTTASTNWYMRLGVQGGASTPPALTSIAPTSAFANATNDVIVKGVTLTGTSMGGSTPSVGVPGGWAATSLVVTGTTSATFDLKIPAGTSPGNNNISFTTTDGTSNNEVFSVSTPSGGLITSLGFGGGFQN